MNGTQTRFRFDPTINLGHLMTMATLLITLVLAYAKLDKRIAVLEQLAVTYIPEYVGTRTDVLRLKALEEHRRLNP